MVLNLRFSQTRAFIEKQTNFTGKNYNRSGLGFFHTFNDSTSVAWIEEEDITDILFEQCPQVSGFVRHLRTQRE
jgi:hypothetical protein